MLYRTPEEVRDLLLNAEYPPELRPMLIAIANHGAFSNKLAGLIDRLQEDDGFRQRVLTDRNGPAEIGRMFSLKPHEVFALVAAAAILDPNDEPLRQPPRIVISPDVATLKKAFSNQRLDSPPIRDSKVKAILQEMVDSSEYAAQVVVRPCQVLGIHDLNLAEFASLYMQACVLNMAHNRSNKFEISGDFLEVTGLSLDRISSEVKSVFRNR